MRAFHTTTYKLAKDSNGTVAARINTLGIAAIRPSSIESIACVIMFIILWMIWAKYKENLPQGRLFGIFLIWCFGFTVFI